MALVTFISDFGNSDYYVPVVKAKMLSINPQLSIVDISHDIALYDIAHAAFLLRSTFNDFPKGTVHLVALNTTSSITDGYIGIKLNEHIFVGPNNGVLSMLADHDPGIIVKFSDIHVKNSSFPAKDILAPIAAKVASGAAIHDFGGPLQGIKKMMGRHFKASKKQIVGYVLRVDIYGNLITNIPKEVFEKLSPGKFEIVFGRESVQQLQTNYNEVEPGDCWAFFNSLGLLEIGINHGHGADLLGLRYDSPILINFEV
ncbi:SAM-dependent chlorinase/fluorinase [uncultured Cyclobacterium sp.]|uniref:SAM hydrolase/SAM-dependent halogenase family protein n=1 Tax=uncultured Cyclobacterium sp. TaxID=453820 RepID=UPI0030EBBF54|tara:strand:+ start:61383 stop:62153 length:771 start_codon:yes stop_codon:yes gene_type:complete